MDAIWLKIRGMGPVDVGLGYESCDTWILSFYAKHLVVITGLKGCCFNRNTLGPV